MRSVGIALVVIGALILGYGGLSSASGGDGPGGSPPAASPGKDGPGQTKPVRLRPVFGGIVLVTGLIVIASTNRRE